MPSSPDEKVRIARAPNCGGSAVTGSQGLGVQERLCPRAGTLPVLGLETLDASRTQNAQRTLGSEGRVGEAWGVSARPPSPGPQWSRHQGRPQVGIFLNPVQGNWHESWASSGLGAPVGTPTPSTMTSPL